MTLKRDQWSCPENQRVKVNYRLSIILDIISNANSGAWSWRTHWLDASGCSAKVGSNLLKTWRMTHCLYGCSPVLVSSSDLLKHWRATHSLDGYSPILVSGSDLTEYWRVTHILDGCSPVLISGSDLLKHWRGTHLLDGCSAILVSGSDLLTNTGEQLTNWMGVQPFLSVVLICSQTLESNSPTG